MTGQARVTSPAGRPYVHVPAATSTCSLLLQLYFSGVLFKQIDPAKCVFVSLTQTCLEPPLAAHEYKVKIVRIRGDQGGNRSKLIRVHAGRLNTGMEDLFLC